MIDEEGLADTAKGLPARAVEEIQQWVRNEGIDPEGLMTFCRNTVGFEGAPSMAFGFIVGLQTAKKLSQD